MHKSNAILYKFPEIIYSMEIKNGTPILPWFDNKLIVLYISNNWLKAYLNKHLEEIKSVAKSQGFRFFWIEDPNIHEFEDLPIVKQTRFTLYDEIDYYLFANNPTEIFSIVRRFDDHHFIGWRYKDIVTSANNIHLPIDLFKELDNIENYRVAETMEETEQFTKEWVDEIPERFEPDPDNDEHDHYFEQFPCQCKECGWVEIYKIPKEIDFYNSLEREVKCARCQKDSWEICSGDIGYYWHVEEEIWHPCFLYIPSGTGYCQECKPYYISNIEKLEFRCGKCAGIYA